MPRSPLPDTFQIHDQVTFEHEGAKCEGTITHVIGEGAMAWVYIVAHKEGEHGLPKTYRCRAFLLTKVKV